MIASLPMYWRDETDASWDAFWRDVRARMPDLPPMTRPTDLPLNWDSHWRAPDLALSQTCGLPYRARLHAHVTYIGTFDFGFSDAPAGSYHSVVLTRPGDARSDAAMRLAYNAPDSQSGWAASEGRAFASYVCTGAHFVSVQAVADGRADIAFVDAVTWRILRAVDPSLAARVTVTEQTRPTPGLPLIAAAGVDPLPLRAALMAALDVIPTQVRQDLGGPVGLSVLNPAAYLALPIPAPPPT